MMPTFLIIRVKDKGRRIINLWIPFFIFWLPMLVIAILLLPLILIVDILFQNRFKRGSFTETVFCFFQLLSSLKGLKVHVDNPKKDSLVEIKFI
ncbi:MAG: hypothetical protein HN356_09525 [Calditrichaeota bacterium]|jgi:hypothetical protein|nr:hypothetical protein [Calditrichota bacterium]MBT7618107.1 hypothetical protein [Calditrichota bacterium]MBT7788481.1 hypothetical protein [Calditrichota bacterium]